MQKWMLLILASLRILECVRGEEEGGGNKGKKKKKTEVGGTHREKRDKNKERGEAGGVGEWS